MLTANDLRNTIVNGLPCDHVEVLGDDGQHFEAVIVSPQFIGKNRVQQLYINGEFVGGADIVREMYEQGELQKSIDSAADR